MCSAKRQLDPGLIADSLERASAYEFFQLVHLYERWFLSRGGRSTDLVGNLVRFGNSLNLGFAPSQVEAVVPTYACDEATHDPAHLAAVEITPSFIGLLGLHGTLPVHYTEQVIKHVRGHREYSGKAFLDLFANRAVSHFYRAWKKYRLPLHYETDKEKNFLPMMLALSGLGFSSLRNRLQATPGKIDDESIAFFSGLLRQRPFSAESLHRVIAGYFGEQIAIEQFVGAWYVVPAEQRLILAGEGGMRLGVDTLVGERVWQRNLRLRIHIGPLSYRRYLAFLPEGELASALQKILSLATSGQFEYEIRPILRARDVHPARLGTSGSRLGYDSFLVCSRERCDRSDTRYFNLPLQ